MTNLSSLLDQAAAEQPDRTAIKLDDLRLSYRQLRQAAGRLAAVARSWGIERDAVTIFEGVPTMFAAMLHHPGACAAKAASLRLCISGGAAMPAEVMRGFEEKFGCVILAGYGLSETSPVASFNHPDRPRKPGSVGTPVQGVEMRLVNDAGNTVPPGGRDRSVPGARLPGRPGAG
jgi:acyl-CoA synthetase (AMP-forming)/AMP-acid ligase II